MSKENQPNDEAKKRGITIGSRIHADPQTLITVRGFDSDGDPYGPGTFGGSPLSEIGRYATECEVIDAPPADQKPHGKPNEEAKRRGIAIGDPKGSDPYKRAWVRDCVVKTPAPSTDQKPRGEKAPLSLLPWDVLAACRLAPPFLQKLHDDIGLLPIDRPRLASIPKERTTDFLSELIEPEAPALGVDLGDVARVFAYGSAKYAPDNWRTFQWDAASDREYWSAFLRHLLADSRGEKNDPESGLPHLAHAVCCLLIVAYHEAKQ